MRTEEETLEMTQETRGGQSGESRLSGADRMINGAPNSGTRVRKDVWTRGMFSVRQLNALSINSTYKENVIRGEKSDQGRLSCSSKLLLLPVEVDS